MYLLIAAVNVISSLFSPIASPTLPQAGFSVMLSSSSFTVAPQSSSVSSILDVDLGTVTIVDLGAGSVTATAVEFGPSIL